MIAAMTALLEGRRARRRDFLAGAVGLAAGAGGLAAGAGRVAEAQAPAINDAAILNFALNLEYLEAEFYTYAVTGNSIEAQGIPTTGTDTGGGDPGPITIKANPKVPFVNSMFAQFAMELAIDEQKHVLDIRNLLGMLGAAPVARPALDLLNSFNMLAMVAGLPTPFDPFAGDINFLLGAYIFEDVGVTAYNGAAPLISSPTVLSYAAGIYPIEGYHAGAIRTFLYQQGQGAATDAISQVRQALGGVTDYGVDRGSMDEGPAGATSIVQTDTLGRAFSRTTRQVLNIIYGAQNAPSGLFFPLGLNGTIR